MHLLIIYQTDAATANGGVAVLGLGYYAYLNHKMNQSSNVLSLLFIVHPST